VFRPDVKIRGILQQKGEKNMATTKEAPKQDVYQCPQCAKTLKVAEQKPQPNC